MNIFLFYIYKKIISLSVLNFFIPFRHNSFL
jgi:hypothetical protein